MSSNAELTKSLLVADGELYMEEYNPPWLPLIVLAFPIMPLFWMYHVDINKQRVSFGYSYPIVSQTVQRTDIVLAEPFEIKPIQQWGGWGIRLRLRPFQTGYICRGGPGVKLTVKNSNGKESFFVFSCQEPETVCEILNKTPSLDTCEDDIVPDTGHVLD